MAVAGAGWPGTGRLLLGLEVWDRCVDWYYRLLSRRQQGSAVGYHVAADNRIVAEWQNPSVGDVIVDGPPGMRAGQSRSRSSAGTTRP